jgi:hypothetical protein
VNYVSHLYVAGQIDPNLGEAFGFGAMLPDLAGMAGTKMDTDQLPDEVAWGVQLHLRTDDVFHHGEDFLGLQREVRKELMPIIPKGARAAAHMGTELLLDGWLLKQTELVERYKATLEWVNANHVTIESAATNGIAMAAFLQRFTDREGDRPRVPIHYKSPRGVATAIQRRIDSRPRMAFDAGKIGELGDALYSHQESVEMAAGPLFEHVLAGIQGE